MDKYAYVTDSYRLMTKVCVSVPSGRQFSRPMSETPGPPLANVHNRLRPGWTERWIASPQRFLHYPYHHAAELPCQRHDYQESFAGRRWTR